MQMGKMVSDEELMLNVWEAHSLSSSTQRLGRVINDLKTILTKAGVLDPVIYRIMGRGYMLDNKYVLTLYAK
jgi:Transcriptional regulatory protein, C terminal.